MLSVPPAPGLELSVLAAMRRLTARKLTQRTGLPYFRVSRILRDVARATPEELEALRKAIFEDSDR